MGFNVGTGSLNNYYQTNLSSNEQTGARDPLGALMQLLDAAKQNGGQIDMKQLRTLLGQLDPRMLEMMMRGFQPEMMHPGARGFMDKLGCGPSSYPTSGPCQSKPTTDMKHCFPQEMEDCFPNACKPQCDPTDPEIPTIANAGKTFDVWFEHKDGQKTKQHSPIVLDLNANGRPDLTGDVKLENGRYVAKGGGKVDFDIDPTKRSWKTKSIQRRPGSGAPKVEGGYAKVYDKDGNMIGDNVPLKDALKRGKKGIQEGRAEVFDQNGQLVGEYKQDEKSGKMMYFFGGRKDAEKSEWMAANGGDALLAWDVNQDGKIDSSKELFGEFDVDGTKKFANGYEKLAAYFDENQDGKVDGQELANAQAQGVRVWKDNNGDAKTDAGELTGLDENGIDSLSVAFDAADLSSTFTQKQRA